MPENNKVEQQKTKISKKRLILTTIRWLFASFFIALIALCLYFQAAWKIIAILVVLIAGLTVLPLKLRKWFYAALALVFICAAVWIFLPDDYEDWQPYTFNEEVAAFNAKYAIPDEQNAAVIYEKLAETFDGWPDFNIPDEDYTFDELSRRMWSGEDYPKYAQWLSSQNNNLNILLNAASYEKCYFPINPSPFIIDTNNIMSSARHWVVFLAVVGNNDLSEGCVKEAIAKYLAILRLGTHFRQQPCSLYKLIGMSIEAIALRQLKQVIVISNVNTNGLDLIENALNLYSCNWNTYFSEIIERQKLEIKNTVGLFYDIHESGKTRISPNPFRLQRELMKERVPEEANDTNDPIVDQIYKSAQNTAYPPYWQLKLLKASTLVLRASLPLNPKKAGQKVNIFFERYDIMLQPEYDWNKNPTSLLSHINAYNFTAAALNFNQLMEMTTGMSEELYHNFYWLIVRYQTDIKGVRLLIALKRYKDKIGNWPDSLTEIEDIIQPELFIDPLSDSSYIYKIKGNEFELYSKGRNNVDEDGNYNSEFDFEKHELIEISDDRMIWSHKKYFEQKKEFKEKDG